MLSAQNQIQIVDTHETFETLAVTRLQRVGYQINPLTLTLDIFAETRGSIYLSALHAMPG
jgi:hypothetical protein